MNGGCRLPKLLFHRPHGGQHGVDGLETIKKRRRMDPILTGAKENTEKWKERCGHSSPSSNLLQIKREVVVNTSDETYLSAPVTFNRALCG